MNEDRDDKDYQIMELKQRVSYYEPYKQKYEDLKEDWKYIKGLLDKEFKENAKIKKEIEKFKKTSKHWVFVDVDTEKGCNNCKHDIGSICDILDCGTHSWIDGVSECGLKYWECKE